MQNMVKFKLEIFAVFKPLLFGLLTNQVKSPSDLRNVVAILLIVYPDFTCGAVCGLAA